MKKIKSMLFLITCISLCGCSFSSEHNIVSISDASMNDMVVEMNGVTIQLYQTLSTLW